MSATGIPKHSWMRKIMSADTLTLPERILLIVGGGTSKVRLS